MTEYIKVAYNNCYGGFSISQKAVRRGREISGDPKWAGPCLNGDEYEDGTVIKESYWDGGIDLERDDPILIQVIEELGDEANGSCAKLAIEKVLKGSLYKINDYDGMESIEYHDDLSGWKISQ